MKEFDAYAELLDPATRGVYTVLSNLYSKHPDLDPLAGLRSAGDLAAADEMLRTEREGGMADGALDTETCWRARQILEKGKDLVLRARAVIAAAEEMEQGQRAQYDGFCSEAVESIDLALKQLPNGL